MELRQALPPALVLTGVTAALPLGAVRVAARAVLGAYAGALLMTAASAARRAPLRDAVALPLVFATMHAAWGSGFLTGCARYGVPARGLATAVAARARRGRGG
jgi:hypothetical protein